MGEDEDDVEGNYNDESSDGRYGKQGSGKNLILNIKWTMNRVENSNLTLSIGNTGVKKTFERVKFSIFYTSGDPHSLNLLKHFAKYHRAIYYDTIF